MRSNGSSINFSFISASAVVILLAAAAYYFYTPKKITPPEKPEKKDINTKETTPLTVATPTKPMEFDDCILEEAGTTQTFLASAVMIQHEKTPDAQRDVQPVIGKFNPAQSQNEVDEGWDSAPKSDDHFYNLAQSAVTAAKKNHGFFAGLAAYNPFATTPANQTVSATALNNKPE
ncbi:MAG: hypothetical protein A3E82_03775 [Gammaproteobacteria bacterium RIFCSPHIGHO2_12_FULL_38_11]|nr:MAG: hypothetical protein A3E82_03775 [Gammaproteobacteria bacterium RIFCSPHIGHO2_12_FULL_38_11]